MDEINDMWLLTNSLTGTCISGRIRFSLIYSNTRVACQPTFCSQ